MCLVAEKKDARLVVAKDEAHAAFDVDVDSVDHDVLVGVASRAWELEPDDLTCAVLALVVGLIHERLPSPQLRHAEQYLDARSLRLEAAPRSSAGLRAEDRATLCR